LIAYADETPLLVEFRAETAALSDFQNWQAMLAPRRLFARFQMASLPTDEDCALRILKTFSEHKLRAGHHLQVQNFNIPFMEDGWTAADYDRGRAYAIKHGWVDATPSGLSLTAAGFAAM
jgi:hypothetical protein